MAVNEFQCPRTWSIVLSSWGVGCGIDIQLESYLLLLLMVMLCVWCAVLCYACIYTYVLHASVVFICFRRVRPSFAPFFAGERHALCLPCGADGRQYHDTWTTRNLRANSTTKIHITSFDTQYLSTTTLYQHCGNTTQFFCYP